MGILNPAMTFLLRVAIKLTGYGFSRPELLARRIESSLGLNAVSSLFLVLPGSAAVSVLRAYGASIGEHVRVNPPLILQNADEGFGNLAEHWR